MADIFTPDQRSAHMRSIGPTDTLPERRVRRVAHSLGLRFRLHRKDLPGTPDLTFPKYKTVVFVHGCFWHRHEGCRKCSFPKTRVDYWSRKFSENVARDSRKAMQLVDAGWHVMTIWECETGTYDRIFSKLISMRERTFAEVSGKSDSHGSKGL